MLSLDMIPDLDFRNALRDCCRDEAAFERLQYLLSEQLLSLPMERGSESESLRIQPEGEEPEPTLSSADLEQQIAEYRLQIQQKNLELQELKRLKEVALNMIAHDLKTFVVGTAMVSRQLLEQSGEMVSMPRSKVERILQASDRQLGMVDSLLETYLTEEQGVILHAEMVCFNSLMETILQDAEPLLKQNQTQIINQLPANLPRVMADPCQIYHMVDHLLLMITQHNPPGLSLTLSATVEDCMLRCTLQDNGLGMSQVECNRLFELHVRNPQARCSTGIGVKLYLCKQIIAAHGGQIGAISSPQQGATFWFTLPLVCEI
ncbi:MAG: HAMP domain-containing sensor histidine kinase [Leptolyngbyaceae cyanobacterium bins.59]|nr:HAMP domain-containing sensor histidine kinase [Leptolyngbyaceae cyanobacterium bins.59]